MLQGDPSLAMLDLIRVENRELYKQFLSLTYYHRGFAYQWKGDKNSAIHDFKKVLELSEDSDRRQNAEQQLQKLEAQ